MQAAENGSVITAEQAEKKVSFSTASKVVFIIAGILAAVGIVLFAKAVITDAIDKKAEQLAEDKNTENDE